MEMENRIHTLHLFKGVDGAITQNTSLKSEIIDLRKKELTGSFALHMITLGGDVTVTVQVCSTKGGNFMAPTSAVTIFATKTQGSYYAAFSLPTAAFMRIVFTENNVSAVTSLNAWLNMQ
jgi:hypothetical protein